MKSPTTKLMTAFFVVAAVISFSFNTKAKKETPKPTYTGHWIAVSGDQYMEVESAEIADDAFKKDEKGKMQEIDKNKVASKLNFQRLSKIEGKNVDAHYFLIGQDEPSADVNMVAPTPKKVWNPCATGRAGYFCNAILACHGASNLPWMAVAGNSCTGSGGFCLAWKSDSPAESPYLYYVICQ
jgi:hypothetical protein